MTTTSLRLLTALLLLTAACGGSDNTQPSPKAITPVLPSPIAPVQADSLRQARLKIDGGPDYLGVGRDALWVKADDGRLHRVDPTTNRIVAVIQAGKELCQGLGVHDDEVWTCGDTGLVRIDPRTNKVATTVPVGRLNDQADFPIAHGHVWVLPTGTQTLHGVSTTTYKSDIQVPLGGNCTGVATTTTSLWIPCPNEDVVLEVDPVAGKVTRRVTGLDAPRTIGAAEHVWVSYAGGIARIDPATATVTGAVKLGTNRGGVYASPGQVWVRAAEDFLRQVDPMTLALVRDLRSPEVGSGSVAVGFGSVWVSVADDRAGSVFRLRI